MKTIIAIRRVKKRFFLMLEVMIALAIVVFAVLPLIYPHFYIYQQQKNFINKLNLDLAVNHLYAHIIEKLHRNEIAWQDIEQQIKHPIDATLIDEVSGVKNSPYKGHYYFRVEKLKKK